jgi:ELWxxDGT repeat protein
LPLAFNPGPFFSFGNLVLFSAADYSGSTSLWVSDGTAAGTKPLSIAGAAGDSLGFEPHDFTRFGGSVLFSGRDVNHDSGLWITDGTAAGTDELTAVLSAGNITVVGGKAFFVDGVSFFGDLWVTDGTAAGTQELSAVGGTLTAFGSKVLDSWIPGVRKELISSSATAPPGAQAN